MKEERDLFRCARSIFPSLSLHNASYLPPFTPIRKGSCPKKIKANWFLHSLTSPTLISMHFLFDQTNKESVKFSPSFSFQISRSYSCQPIINKKKIPHGNVKCKSESLNMWRQLLWEVNFESRINFDFFLTKRRAEKYYHEIWKSLRWDNGPQVTSCCQMAV